MTFLELCQRLRLEAGITGTGPVTVTGQVGDYEKIVAWILSAYEDVQNAQASWNFLRDDFSFSTASTIQEYTRSTSGVTELGTWIPRGMTVYSSVADESDLEYLPWETFRALYLRGTNRSLSQRPSTFSIKPDNSLIFWPIPDGVYTINGEYYKRAQTMTADADEPIFSRFHMVIVWRALIYHAAKIAADEKYAHGKTEYTRLMNQLRMAELPKVTWGATLA